MPEAKTGDTVRVQYRGSLKDASVFDESDREEPLEFQIGEGQVIPGFERAVVGMRPGESKTITIPAAAAYGVHRADMVVTIDRAGLSDDLQIQVGDELQVSDDGREVRVTALTDTTITLDANHPLAGEDLTFLIELVEVV